MHAIEHAAEAVPRDRMMEPQTRKVFGFEAVVDAYLEPDPARAAVEMVGHVDVVTLSEDIPGLAVKAFLVTYDYSRGSTVSTLRKFARSLCENFPTLQASGHPKWREVNLALPALVEVLQVLALLAQHVAEAAKARAHIGFGRSAVGPGVDPLPATRRPAAR